MTQGRIAVFILRLLNTRLILASGNVGFEESWNGEVSFLNLFHRRRVNLTPFSSRVAPSRSAKRPSKGEVASVKDE